MTHLVTVSVYVLHLVDRPLCTPGLKTELWSFIINIILTLIRLGPNWSMEEGGVCHASDLLSTTGRFRQRGSLVRVTMSAQGGSAARGSAAGSIKDLCFMDMDTCFWQMARLQSLQHKVYSGAGIPYLGSPPPDPSPPPPTTNPTGIFIGFRVAKTCIPR